MIELMTFGWSYVISCVSDGMNTASSFIWRVWFVCLFVSSLLLSMNTIIHRGEINHAAGQAGLSYATCHFSAVCEAFTLETSFLCVLETTDDPNGFCGLYIGQACTCSTLEVPQSMDPDITTVSPGSRPRDYLLFTDT